MLINNIDAIIAGIYLSGMEKEQTDKTLAVYRIENAVYGKTELATQLQNQKGYESVVIYLKNPEEITSIVEQISKLMFDKTSITKSDTLFQQMKQPLEQIVRVVKLMMILSVGTAIIVVTLLLCMWMRARKKETAVYISLGETKVSIFLQIILESALVFIASTSMSIITGSFMANVLKNALFSKDEITTSSLQIGLKSIDIGWLLISGAGILAIAVGISLIPILVANPKDTLSEMEG